MELRLLSFISAISGIVLAVTALVRSCRHDRRRGKPEDRPGTAQARKQRQEAVDAGEVRPLTGEERECVREHGAGAFIDGKYGPREKIIEEEEDLRPIDKLILIANAVKRFDSGITRMGGMVTNIDGFNYDKGLCIAKVTISFYGGSLDASKGQQNPRNS